MLMPMRSILGGVFGRRRVVLLERLTQRAATTAASTSASPSIAVLPPYFRLDREWNDRLESIAKLNVGTDYEWIASVQRKFQSGGHGSAVDVDVAVCIADEKDQVADVLDLVYKLRHSPATASLQPSTEYALIRLLLRHEPDAVLTKLANDPINYGIFPDVHAGMLVLAHYLGAGNVQGATRFAGWLMQQELLESRLLNLLALHVTTKWIELPTAEERKMPALGEEEKGEGEDEGQPSDENEHVFKVPYLKNPYNDGHFDIVSPADLAAKTLRWFARETKDLDPKLLASVQLLASALAPSSSSAELIELAKKSHAGAISTAITLVSERAPKEDEAQQKALNELKATLPPEADQATEKRKISEILLEAFQIEMKAEGTKLADAQRRQIADWETRRQKLMVDQADKVRLTKRRTEITDRLEKLTRERDTLHFFENLLQWEARVAEADEVRHRLDPPPPPPPPTEKEKRKMMKKKTAGSAS